jgi:CRP-like cAMP-binding protein
MSAGPRPGRASGAPAARPRSPAELAAFLAPLPPFAPLTSAARLALAEAGHVRALARGQLLFSQDDPADCVYVVCSGQVAILLAAADGRELAINELGPGELFGEVGLLEGACRTATALARQPTEVLVLPGAAFLAALEAEPRALRRLLATLAARLRGSGERESALAFLSAPARLARLLLQASAAAGGGLPLVTLSQEEAAQRIGVTRQTVAKILGGWRRTGWIVTGRGRIMLVNTQALRRLAEL